MALLTDQARQEEWAEFMRKLSARRQPMGLLKGKLRLVFNAADDWVHANRGSYNAAINAVLTTEEQAMLTAADKAEILMEVVGRRYLDGTA